MYVIFFQLRDAFLEVLKREPSPVKGQSLQQKDKRWRKGKAKGKIKNNLKSLRREVPSHLKSKVLIGCIAALSFSFPGRDRKVSENRSKRRGTGLAKYWGEVGRARASRGMGHFLHSLPVAFLSRNFFCNPSQFHSLC